MSRAAPPVEPGAPTLLSYFEQSVEALNFHEAAARRGAAATSRYDGLTVPEVQGEFRLLREELEREVSLALFAALEAALRLDCEARIARRRKDATSKALGKLHRASRGRKRSRPRLEDIIDVWSAAGQAPQAFRLLRAHLRRRHWLAHGRCWTDKSGVSSDPWELSDLLAELAAKVPGFPTVR